MLLCNLMAPNDRATDESETSKNKRSHCIGTRTALMGENDARLIVAARLSLSLSVWQDIRITRKYLWRRVKS